MVQGPLSFRDLDLPAIIDTSQRDFITEFYTPLLSRASEYKRGVGYFTSGWLGLVCDGMATLAENGGTAKIVASPILEEADWEAIKRGERARHDETLRRELQRSVQNLRTDLEEESRNTLAWLIADGILNIRFGVPTADLDGGEFHDKFGIVTAPDGDKVAFHGSQNDSEQGQRNYESYDVFCNWETDREAERVTAHETRFDKIWYNDTPQLNVYRLPDSVKDGIAQLREENNRPYDLPEGHNALGISLRDYQRDAVAAWPPEPARPSLHSGLSMRHLLRNPDRLRSSFRFQ